MTTLSTAEATAGISQKALATLKGNGDSPHPTLAERIAGVQETRIISEPYRQLSVLETRDGDLVLRNVEFVGSKADVQLIHLAYEQSRTLAQKILERFHQHAPEPKPPSRGRA